VTGLKRIVGALVLVCNVAGVASAQQTAQEPGARAGMRRGAAQVSVAEAERIFERYMLGQARVALQLSPEQMVPFAQRFERLLMTQRQRQRQRLRLLAELNRSGEAGTEDESAVSEALGALDAGVAAADVQVRDARADLEEILSVRQRARYRAFEARMEREKLQLIARARANGRRGAQQSGTAP
jgi:hypothetical protein